MPDYMTGPIGPCHCPRNTLKQPVSLAHAAGPTGSIAGDGDGCDEDESAYHREERPAAVTLRAEQVREHDHGRQQRGERYPACPKWNRGYRRLTSEA
jgi:hypothetical protein